MLDVSRHFQSVENVKRVIDQAAYYKLNYFHLHLADDQGWRIEINGWPNLTAYGGQTQVGGNCADCFYTQEQYVELVNHAAARYITLVPEIEMPGHTNAALSSYPGLNCNGNSPPRRTDIEVGYSSLCTTQPLSTAVVGFVNDVISQVAMITPGPYFHIGGDESLATSQDEYSAFISYAQSVVNTNGKAMLGWEEVAQIPDLASTSVVQFWYSATYAESAVEHGAKIVMSPCAKAYLDFKYDPGTRLGLDWCGYTLSTRCLFVESGNLPGWSFGCGHPRHRRTALERNHRDPG